MTQQTIFSVYFDLSPEAHSRLGQGGIERFTSGIEEIGATVMNSGLRDRAEAQAGEWIMSCVTADLRTGVASIVTDQPQRIARYLLSRDDFQRGTGYEPLIVQVVGSKPAEKVRNLPEQLRKSGFAVDDLVEVSRGIREVSVFTPANATFVLRSGEMKTHPLYETMKNYAV